MKKSVLLLCLIALFLSGCATMDMRKISVEPKISTENMRKSSMKAGLLLNDQFTNYKYKFESDRQLFLLSKVRGEIDIGKNLSHALYRLVSGKFGNIAIAKDARDIQNVSVYFVPRIKYFNYSPPYTGVSSHTVDAELETEIFAGNGLLLRSFIVKGKGSRNIINQLKMETNYDMVHYAVNEAIDNLLKEFSRKLDEFY